MRPNIMIERLRKGEVLLGLTNMYPATGIIEGMCHGWDFVWIDGQHGQMSYDSTLRALQTAGAAGLETMVRVPGHEHGFLGPFADLAPSAIMVPMVNDADEAKAVVDGLRFPPLGKRSYGGRRVIDIDGRDYYRERELLVVAQIETLDAVKNADAIIETEGIDALFFGPDDMKVRMGIAINTPATENEQLRKAYQVTAKAARRAGKWCGSVAPSPAMLKLSVESGYQILVGGGDIVFMRTIATTRLAELRTALEESSDAASKAQASAAEANAAGRGVY